ncbi:hypothetical protein [Wenyingzhuangia sp. IMCC45574]
MENELIVGGIYELNWGAKIVRVISFDDYEVLYDIYWTHSKMWAFSSNITKKCYFHRLSTASFLSKSNRIDYLKLTDVEKKSFNPYVSIRACRVNNLSWDNKALSNPSYIAKRFNIGQMEGIDASKIWIYPFKCNNSFSCAKLIHADNQRSFSGVELLTKAYAIQNAVNPIKTEGIGIYRIGIQDGIPSYYIGEYYDIAGIMKEEEGLTNFFKDSDARELLLA